MELDILQQILYKVTSLESKVTSIESDVKDLKQGLARLEQRQENLERGQAEMASLLHGVIQHQNEDFALLQAVSDKVDRLAGISEAHEQKFQRLKSI